MNNGAAPKGGDLNAGMQLLMRICEVMSQTPLRAHTINTLAEQPDVGNTSTTQISRALRNMQAQGWAEEANKGCWVLSPGLVHIAERMRLAIAHRHQRYLADAAEANRVAAH